MARRSAAQRTKDAVSDTRSALERAAEGPVDNGALGNQAVRLVENVLDLGVDGKGWFDSAQQAADKALRATGGDREAAIDAVVRRHLVKGGVEGFVTSLGGFITLPVALPVWRWPDAPEWLALLGVGVFTHLAQLSLTRGLALETAGRAVSLNYLQIVLGAGIGLAWFGEWPDASTLLGAAIIVATTIGLVVVDPAPAPPRGISGP